MRVTRKDLDLLAEAYDGINKKSAEGSKLPRKKLRFKSQQEPEVEQEEPTEKEPKKKLKLGKLKFQSQNKKK
jgi:regulatory protein YycI of two-component signal transduction system YycFG